MSNNEDDCPPPLVSEDSYTSDSSGNDSDDVLPQLEAISPAGSEDESEYDSEYDDEDDDEDDDDDDDDYDEMPDMLYAGSDSDDEYESVFLSPQLHAQNSRHHQDGSRPSHPSQQNPSHPPMNDPNGIQAGYYPNIVVVADVQGAPFPVMGDQMDFESVWFGGNGIRFPAPFPVFQVRFRRI
jgi:hypothetical protein